MEKEIHDPVLGTLTFNEERERYETTINWNGAEINLYFPTDDESMTLYDLLPTAYTLYKEQKEWDQKIREYAANKLLELKNSTWLEDEEKELTPDDFMRRITPYSLEVFPKYVFLEDKPTETQFTMLFDDADIFWGHAIEVWGNLQTGPTSADMT